MTVRIGIKEIGMGKALNIFDLNSINFTIIVLIEGNRNIPMRQIKMIRGQGAHRFGRSLCVSFWRGTGCERQGDGTRD
jgi:hypothetical protein